MTKTQTKTIDMVVGIKCDMTVRKLGDMMKRMCLCRHPSTHWGSSNTAISNSTIFGGGPAWSTSFS